MLPVVSHVKRVERLFRLKIRPDSSLRHSKNLIIVIATSRRTILIREIFVDIEFYRNKFLRNEVFWSDFQMLEAPYIFATPNSLELWC